jgi:glycyl-tRNA synthetase beta chain
MPQLLLEFFSEEIPARMQARAEQDLERLLMDRLTAAGFIPEGVKAFAGPRRLAAVVEGLPARSADVREERKGPRVGAPEKAIEGFLRGAGLASIEAAKVQADPKGDFYVALIEKPGRQTRDVVAEIVPEIVRAFPWPKSMRSADQDLYWVRPLQRILCAFDGEAVEIALPGVESGRTTSGHRFHAPAPFEVRRFDDYAQKLKAARVIVSREERKATILAEARTLCAARNLELVEDPGLLEETSGLVEWPIVLLGDMDPAFLDLPGEVIRLTMRTHQKYFAVRDPKTQKLAPHFVVVANIEAIDGGKAIAAGNARVLSARLNDARFFWAKDGGTDLYTDERREKLKEIVFHQKLGSVWDKVARVKALALKLCAATGADARLVERAADLAKMDLVTETVGEFPELQGQIGRQLAEGKEHASVAIAIEDHYRPLGPNDRVPNDPVAITLALADKLDTLAGFWAIGEKPTGSSDAFGLRRAALGVVRIVLENKVRLVLRYKLQLALTRFNETAYSNIDEDKNVRDMTFNRSAVEQEERQGLRSYWVGTGFDQAGVVALADQLLAFLADRLKVQLREQGKRHDLVDAVFALGDDDLVRIVARVEALSEFLNSEDGRNLLAGYKRAANIIAAEEKKGRGLTEQERAAGVAKKLLEEPAERALHDALANAKAAAAAAADREDYGAAMAALAPLRAPVDAFFEAVLVNAEDPALRVNRLNLLHEIRTALHAVADFSKIEG